MNIPPFVLVHRPGGHGKGANPTEEAWLDDVAQEAPEIGQSLRALRTPFRSTLLRSALGQVGATPRGAANSLLLATQELRRQPRVETVGLWDVGAGVGHLPAVIATLNVCQPAFALFQVQAAVPAGVVSGKDKVAEWFRRRHRIRLSAKDLKTLDNNIIAEDFLPRVDRVRRDMGLHYLIAITPSMIAGWQWREGPNWNYFDWWDDNGRDLLVSAYDLPKYASRAGRPFEAAVAWIAISALLNVVNPDVEVHADRGCLFDENQDRDSIVESIRRSSIDPECLRRILPRYRASAEAMITALRSYQPKGE